ncbi:MAG: hypothetical protein ACXU9C_28375 [Xanthobacteraceae bacterium]
MHKFFSVIVRLVAAAGVIATLSGAGAAPLAPSPEDRYVATRNAAIAKFSPIYDAGKFDDAAKKAEEAAFADLTAQMTAILGETGRKGFGPAKLNVETFYKGDEGFGTLDGLKFDSELGENGEKAGSNSADGKYVEPRAHIIVTTQTLFARWLRAHKDWWDKDLKNVPQQIGSALKSESFYTQAISTDSAVIDFNSLPIAKPASATFTYGFLAGRTQSEISDAADEVFVSALANGKVHLAYGSIAPKVQIAACMTIRADYNKKAEDADNKFRSNEIDRKAYDKLGDFRQQGEDAYKRCFAQRAPQQPSFADATRQAQALLAVAMEGSR